MKTVIDEHAEILKGICAQIVEFSRVVFLAEVNCKILIMTVISHGFCWLTFLVSIVSFSRLVFLAEVNCRINHFTGKRIFVYLI